MKSKKILSLVLVLCMILPLIPVFASDVAQTGATGNVRVIYENDFESNIDGWVIGETLAKDGTYSLSHETFEDKGVLALSSTAKITNYMCQQPTAFLDFDDIDFTSGNKIVIEMSLKQSGANEFGQVWSYLKYNRPNKSDLTYAKADGSNFHTGNVAEDADNWWSMLKFQADTKEVTNEDGTTTASGSNNVSYVYNSKGDAALKVLSETDTKADWTDIKIVIDEGTKYFSVNAKTGDQEYAVTDGWIGANPYEINNTNIAYGTQLTDYDSLDNLTLYLRQYPQTLYLDSFKVYEISPTYTDAVIVGGSTVKYDEAIQLKFVNVYADADKTTASTIAAVPEGAVKINGANAVQNYDAVNQVLSVIPEGGFVEGETYTVTFDTDVLQKNGIIYTGTETFNVLARGEYSTGIVLNDNFATGTDNWIIGEAYSDDYKATITPVDAEGAVDGKALKIEFPTKEKVNKSDSTAAYGSVTKAVGNGLEFSDDATITLKTRVKKTDSATPFELRLNRPNTVDQVKHDYEWNTYYSAFLQHAAAGGIGVASDSVLADIGNYPGLYGYHGFNVGNATKVDLTGKWVEYTLDYKPAEGKYYLTAAYTNDNGETVTLINNFVGYMRATKPVLDKEFGLGYFNYESGRQFFNDFRTLTFTSAGGEILVDYVKVFNPFEAYATMPEGSSVKYDEAIKLQFASDMAIPSISAGAVKINGVNAAQEYDAETKTLSVKPVNADSFTAGEVYTVTIDKDVLAGDGITYTGTESFSVRARDEYDSGIVLSDNFAAGTDNWVVGKSQSGYEATMEPVDAEGAVDGKALKVTFPAAGSGTKFDTGRYGSVVKSLGDGVKFSTEETLTVKARVKADTAMEYQIKANRPNTLVQPDNDFTWAFYNALLLHSTTGDLSVLGGSLYSSDVGGTVYNYRANTKIATNDDTGLWTEYTIVFKPAEEKYYVTVVTTDAEGNETTVASNKVGHMLATRSELETEFGIGYFDAEDGKYYLDLSSLTFTSRTAGNLYIDYVKVFEQADGRIINHSGASAMYNEPLKFTLESSKPIAVISDGAVAIAGVEAAQTYDAETQTITLTPAKDLTPGETYTVTIDKDILADDSINYTGVTSFLVRARDERETGLVISDNFDDGKTQGWTIGAANNGYKAGLDVVDIEGEEGNKALKVSMNAIKEGDGNQPNVTRVLGNGIEFKNGEWVTITTRVKKSSEGFSYKLKANRPDTITQVLHEYEWGAHGIMGNTKEGKTTTATATYGINGVPNGEYTEMPADPEAKTVGTDWITYTIVFKPETGCYWITGVKDDGTYVTNPNGRVGAMYLAGTAHEAIYGVVPQNRMSIPCLENLTFVSQEGTTGDLYIDYINVSINNTNIIGKAELTVNGKEIEEITAGTTVKPVFTINPEEGVTEYTVISALYIDGILEDTHINPVTATKIGYVYTEEDGWTIPSALEGKYEIKAFVWNSLEGMKPVSTVTKAESAAND